MRSRAPLLPALAALAALLTAFPALARAEPMNVGLYADMAGTETELSVPAFTPFWLYLVVDRPLTTFLGDFCADKRDSVFTNFSMRLRCRFEIPGNMWIINFDESVGGRCGSYDLWRDPEIDAWWVQWVCYYTTWLPPRFCGTWPCMMGIALMGFDERPAPIRMLPGADGGTAEDLPVFDYQFTSCWGHEFCRGSVGLYPLPAGPDHPVFVVNRGAVDVDERTWGALKALYGP